MNKQTNIWASDGTQHRKVSEQACKPETSLASKPRASLGRLTPAFARDSFLLRCRAMSLSPNTLAWYQNVFRDYLNFLESKEITSVDISADTVRSYLDLMAQKGRAKGTISRRYGSLKCFYNFLVEERMIQVNPMLAISKPKMSQKLVKRLSQEQIQLLLKTTDQKSFPQLTIWTMIVLILDTGLRVSEVVSLELEKIAWNSNSLKVRGKGDKEREVPFGLNCKKALWSYFLRRGELENQPLFFVNRFGGRTDRDNIRQDMVDLAKKAGLAPIHPHLLRHTFAVEYLLNGGDALSLQRILGHSTLEMVRHYVNLSQQEISLQHSRFSPMDKLAGLPGVKRKVLLK